MSAEVPVPGRAGCGPLLGALFLLIVRAGPWSLDSFLGRDTIRRG